jgi:hypothetical protein
MVTKEVGTTGAITIDAFAQLGSSMMTEAYSGASELQKKHHI